MELAENNNFPRASPSFLLISLPTLHDYDVKMPNFTMYTSNDEISWFLGIQLSRVRLNLTKLVTWSNRDEDEVVGQERVTNP